MTELLQMVQKVIYVDSESVVVPNDAAAVVTVNLNSDGVSAS